MYCLTTARTMYLQARTIDEALTHSPTFPMVAVQKRSITLCKVGREANRGGGCLVAEIWTCSDAL
jgi:hypothetical protein